VIEGEGTQSNFTQETEEIVNELSADWKANRDPQHQPFVLLVGGLQGSGKTTLLRSIQDELTMEIIAGDQIRQHLLDVQVPLEKVSKLVEYASLQLLQRALHLGISVTRICEMMQKHKGIPYRQYSVLLQAPQEVLEQRIVNRPHIPGVYSGTVQELCAHAVRYGNIDKAAYDLVVSTEHTAPESLRQLVLSKLHAIQAHQSGNQQTVSETNLSNSYPPTTGTLGDDQCIENALFFPPKTAIIWGGWKAYRKNG
jgi:cytidylate kinase